MYQFNAEVWRHNSSGGWHIVSVPVSISKEIRSLFGDYEEGWGRLRATVTIGASTWESAVWFDTKQASYLLPLKADIRKKEEITIGMNLEITLKIN